MIVFTGKRSGIFHETINVTGHPGPWNIEARKMFGALKSYVGSDATVRNCVKERDLWSPFLQRYLESSDNDANGQRRSSVSLENLARAREIVVRGVGLGTVGDHRDPNATNPDGTGIPSWLLWLIGGVIVVALLRSCS